jgi:hypothetical protein
MEMKLEIPEYDKNVGFKYYWEYGFEIKVSSSDNKVSISANKAGLISLAIQMLTIAQDAVPVNYYTYLDEYNSLEEGSKELVIQKI